MGVVVIAVAHSGSVVAGGPWQETFFADQWVAKGSENGLGGKTEKAFKKELGGLGFTLNELGLQTCPYCWLFLWVPGT